MNVIRRLSILLIGRMTSDPEVELRGPNNFRFADYPGADRIRQHLRDCQDQSPTQRCDLFWVVDTILKSEA